MKKINYFFNFIKSYRLIFFKVFFFELFYSLKFKELFPLIKIHNHKYRTDTVPCVFYFIYKISKFIKQNKIKSVVDVGSGYGRVVNSLSVLNKVTARVDIVRALIKENFIYEDLRVYPIHCNVSDSTQKSETSVYFKIYS